MAEGGTQLSVYDNLCTGTLFFRGSGYAAPTCGTWVSEETVKLEFPLVLSSLLPLFPYVGRMVILWPLHKTLPFKDIYLSIYLFER